MLEKLDIYGQKVQLKNKGRSTYNTPAGGILSILSVLIFTGCMILKVFDGSVYLEKKQASEIQRRNLGHTSEDSSNDYPGKYRAIDVFDYGI